MKNAEKRLWKYCMLNYKNYNGGYNILVATVAQKATITDILWE